jgi:hypothetical protein
MKRFLQLGALLIAIASVPAQAKGNPLGDFQKKFVNFCEHYSDIGRSESNRLDDIRLVSDLIIRRPTNVARRKSNGSALIDNPLYLDMLRMMDGAKLFKNASGQPVIAYERCPMAMEDLLFRITTWYEDALRNQQGASGLEEMVKGNAALMAGFIAGSGLRALMAKRYSFLSKGIWGRAIPYLGGAVGMSVPEIYDHIRKMDDPFPHPLAVVRLGAGPRMSRSEDLMSRLGFNVEVTMGTIGVADLAITLLTKVMPKAKLLAKLLPATVTPIKKVVPKTGFVTMGLMIMLDHLLEKQITDESRSIELWDASEKLKFQLASFIREFENHPEARDRQLVLRARQLIGAADQYYGASYSPYVSLLLDYQDRYLFLQKKFLREMLHQEWVLRTGDLNTDKWSQYPDVDLTMQHLLLDIRASRTAFHQQGLDALAPEGEPSTRDPFTLPYGEWIKDHVRRVQQRQGDVGRVWSSDWDPERIREHVRPETREFRDAYCKYALGPFRCLTFAEFSRTGEGELAATYAMLEMNMDDKLSADQRETKYWTELYIMLERYNRKAILDRIFEPDLQKLKELSSEYVAGHAPKKDDEYELYKQRLTAAFRAGRFEDKTQDYLLAESGFWTDVASRISQEDRPTLYRTVRNRLIALQARAEAMTRD